MYSVPLSGNQQSGLISIGTNISSDNASIANASITSLSVVDFKSATFSPHTINTSTINASSISLDPNFVFPVLNVATLNSIEESFVNVSAVNISANNITADNIQPLLVAGDNITIDANNTISALNNNLPATGNFTTLNTSQLNASNISTGDLTFDSHFTLSNKFLTVNSTTNITENSPDLITSGAVYNALNKFSVNISDGRSLTNTKLIQGGDVIKPIIPGTVSSIDTEVDPGTSKNIMKVFYTTKFGPDAILSVVANFGYQVDGIGTDQITARLEYNNGSTNNNIGQQEQSWTAGVGGGTRSGVLSPRQGVRRAGVSAQTTVYFQIIIQNDSDDTFTFLTPNACNFHITESLDNAGSDLNLNTGNLQADEANFNSLTVQAGSGSGQATIGRTYLGNNAFGNMAALSVNGNDGATNYGFAQVSSGNTIMNAMPSSYNSFRCENVEVASIGQIGLGIGLGTGNTASFPLEVSGDSLVSGIMFASEVDTNDADITNISNTNLSGTKATFEEINVSGNLIVNGTTFTTTNLTAGENITIADNVISAFFGSGGQVNLNYIQVDGGVDIGGVLNVSQTSNFSNSLNVGDILYAGEAGNHEGSVVIYSNNVGDNYTTKINSSTFEVNTSATGNLSAINFFVGNNKSLEISNSGIQTDNIITDSIEVADLTADVFTCIDGRATFRFNTPQLNASNASIDIADIGEVNASVVTCDVLDTDELDLDVLNVSTLNFSQALGNTLDVNVCINTSNLNVNQIANISRLIIDDTNDGQGIICLNTGAYFETVFIDNTLNHTGSDMYLGSPGQAPNTFGGSARSRLNCWAVNPSYEAEVGTRMGINENSEAFLLLEPNGGVSNYTININNFSTMNMTETETTFNHRLNASNISGEIITANTIDANTLKSNNAEIMNDVDIYNDLFVANRIDATTIDALDVVGDNGDFGLLESSIIRATTANSSTINSSNGNFSGLVVNATGTFQSVVANIVNVAGTLNATNIPGYQEELTAGNNISIVNNVISAIVEEFPADANFSSVTADEANISQVNCSSVIVETEITANKITAKGFFEVGEIGVGGVDMVFYGPLLASKIEMELLENDFNVSSSVDNINFKIDNNVKASITQTGLNASDINGDTSIINTMNSSVINTSFFSCIDEAGFSGLMNANIVSCNEFDADEVIINNNIRSRVYNISDNLDQSEASVLFRDGNITQLLHSGGRIRMECNSMETDVGNFSTVNASVINGSNLSTASIAFNSDFLFDTFSNTLRLAEDPQQAVASVLAQGIDTPNVDTNNLTVDDFSTLNVVAITTQLNSVTNNLFNINSSGTANISVINNSTLNSITGNFSSVTVTTGNFSVCDVNGSFTVGNIMGGPAVLSSVESTGNLRGVNASVDNMSVDDTLRATIVNCNDVDCLKLITNNISVSNISVSTKLTTPSLAVNGPFSLSGTLSTSKGNITNISNDNISTKTLTAQFSLKSPLLNVTVLNVSNVDIQNNFTCKDIDARAGSVLKMPTGNFSTINSSVINGDNLSTASISFNPTDFDFVGGELSLVGDATLPADANFSSVTTDVLNASTVNGDNLSTASIAFNNDFLFDTFSNTLRLAEDPQQAVASALAQGIDTPSVNTSSLTVEDFSTLNVVAITTQLNSTTNNLFSINSSGTANISTINSSVINGDNLSTASISFNPTDFDFSNGELSLVGGGSGISTVAIAKINDNGDNLNVIGCFVTRNSTGRYTLTFDNSQPDSNYVVQLTVMETTNVRDDAIITFDSGTASTTGFSYFITEQDNGTTAGVYIDRPHFITVSASGSGGGGGGGGGGGSLPENANFSSVTTDTLTVNNQAVFGGNMNVAGYINESNKPRFRVQGSNNTISAGQPLLRNMNESTTFNVNGNYNATGSLAGMYQATIAGTYWVFCKCRFPDSNSQIGEIQWYKRATNGAISAYETFEMWMATGSQRRATSSGTLIELAVGECVFPRSDFTITGDNTVTFSGYKIS